MKLDHPVVDRLGRNLVARGAELDDYMIDSLLKLGIMSVYIQEGGRRGKTPEQVPTSPEQKKISNGSVPKTAQKVTLSASIRERVSTGIQFIYNNTTSEEMVATTESIADDLMRPLKSNDAIAIDISTLKPVRIYIQTQRGCSNHFHDRCQAAGTLSRRSTGNRCLWFAARHWKKPKFQMLS